MQIGGKGNGILVDGSGRKGLCYLFDLVFSLLLRVLLGNFTSRKIRQVWPAAGRADFGWYVMRKAPVGVRAE